jgi:dTDP-4-dehydrorhamnose reductase
MRFKKKVVILGDGLLGNEIFKETNWDVLSRKKTNFDINDLNKSFKNNDKIDVIINCIANTDTYSKDKKPHWDVNFAFVSNLIKYCNSNLIKLVHISTDYIYSNSIENASEEDVPVHCDNWYGYTKLLADGLVQLEANDYLLIRCTHKPNPFPYEKAWENQVGNFDYVDVIAKHIIKLIIKNANGVYNVGTEIKTMFDLASITKKVKPIKAPSHIPNNTSMNLSKMEKFFNKEKEIEKPFFSIAIPAYGYGGKGAEFLNDNFKKLNTQTFKDFEIVVSDHSIDDTIKMICDKWSERLNIKYYKNEYGRGMISPNLNVAMKYSNGKWIKILFQDDFLYDENSLKNQYNALELTPNIKWLITTFCHSNDGINFYNLYNPKLSDNIWSGANTLGNPSNLTILNKDLIFFDEELNWYMDCEYYYRLFLKYGPPTIIPQITVVNRTHGNGLTNTISQEIKNKELKMLIKKYA